MVCEDEIGFVEGDMREGGVVPGLVSVNVVLAMCYHGCRVVVVGVGVVNFVIGTGGDADVKYLGWLV